VSVVVWVFDLDGPTPDGRLSDEEHQRALSLPQGPRRRRWVAAHRALRWSLRQTAGPEAEACVIRHTATGKPYAEGVFFSLSHSGPVGAVAVADRPVGVDVEADRRVSRPDLLARRLKVQAQWLAIDEDRRDGWLLERWARAEALLKGTGEGLAGGPATAEERLAGQGWAVHTIALPTGVGAVAAQGTGWAADVAHWEAADVAHWEATAAPAGTG